jgi:flavin reductase (DIM6/NTAB) family NADH-FMN oxidoreductase RutF
MLLVTLKKIQNLMLPLPVSLVTCRGKKGDESTDNIISLSWVGIVEYQPHLVNIVIGKGKYSAKIIEKTREFGICIATVDMMEKVDICGYTHGDKVDKFKITGLTKVNAEKIDVSLIKECPICMECIVEKVITLKTHEMFIGKVLATHINDKYLLEGEEPDIKKMDILCYVNDQYWSLGKRLENLYYSKNKIGK